MKAIRDFVCAIAVVACCGLVLESIAVGQSSRDRRRESDSPSSKALEVRLQKAEELLVSEYRDVAVEFYKQGDKEKSMAMLRRLKELQPDLEGLDDKIKEISEELMQENADDLDIDTRRAHEWSFVGDVLDGRAFRLQASGEYKLQYSTSVTVEGLQTEKESPDYLPAEPLGCLIGVIVSDGKPGKPFSVKSELEQTPKKDGKLFLKVNVPEGTRCTGKIRVHVSGYISTGATSSKP
ncbi:MAG: hypothetical protein KDA81_09410 [Planctomycetaceae bacterium]|nr:hypothetical protein [Planctomycetaceae bacterium]